MRRLSQHEWFELSRIHREKAEAVLRPHRERKSRHETHPVYDFLFSYYSFRTSNLDRWTPGFGVILEGDRALEFLELPGFARDGRGVFMEAGLFPEKRRQSLRHVRDFLKVTSERTPNFGCAGLHEWAMVYRTPEVRYENLPLRMAPGELEQFVASQNIACSHFDAFRFFTAEARPLNRLQPARDKQMALDQPGCLHVNMDLYKWAYKFSPWVSSELIWDCFCLAARTREIDMRASPYDLRSLGFEPIRIETAEGRKEYEVEQRSVLAAAAPLRKRLWEVYNDLVLAQSSLMTGQP